jgi:hypothetical protein
LRIEQLGRCADVAVRVARKFGPREADGVVDARVVLAVAGDHVAAADEGGHGAEVRHVTAREDEGRLGALEGRKVGLQRGVGVGVPGEQAAGARAPAPPLDRAFGGLAHPWVSRKAKIIVGGEL